ncbi:c-type cytochrome [Luteibacter sp.]|uniref:c-type cytochrome n=1 Tax=Luteibacter sp. TaxID=1886636 RepID=UPI003F7F90ED
MTAPRLLLLGLLLALAGCERGMHDMYDQPRYKRGAEAPLFKDTVAAREVPVGTVPVDDPSDPALSPLARLERGRERYTIYCAPCHGAAGDGDGMVVRRGFPAPPSYHQARLRQADDGHFEDVIAHGWGIMYPYGDRVAPSDRAAIVAYIRALQFSREVPIDRLEPQDIQRLKAMDAAAARR